MMDPTNHRRFGAEAGQATVELALCLPLVAIAALGVLQISLVARDDVLVTHAAREAARAAAVGADPGEAAAAAARTSGLDPARLEVAVAGSPSAGSRLIVTVRYRCPTDVPIIGPLMREVHINTKVTIRAE
jgi:Flp pilus assembly protein TadG